MTIRVHVLAFIAVLLPIPALLAQTSTPSQASTPLAASDLAEQSKLRADLDWARKTLADWPNLGRYRDENARLATTAAQEDRVVFMGDSITDGWGRRYGVFFPG